MMYEKDLLMRMLTTFLQKLAEKLSNRSVSELTDSEIEDFYSTAIEKERSSIIELNGETLLDECMVDGSFSIEKCRVLAELLYIEAFKHQDNKKREFAEKSLRLFDVTMQQTKTYDVEIINKMELLRQFLRN